MQSAGRIVEAQAYALGDRGEGICALADAEQSRIRGHRPSQEIRIHVPGLLPHEQAQVELLHVSPHRQASGPSGQGFQEAWGRLVRRENAMPERVLPACSAYGQCGGCVLQHLAYPAQLRFKQQQVERILGETVAPIVSVGSPLTYRSRVKLVAAQSTRGNILLGAYAPRSHTVLDMAGCQINLPSLTALAKSIAQEAARQELSCYDEGHDQGTLRYVLLRETQRGDQQVSLVIADSLAETRLKALVKALVAAHPRLKSVVLHHNADRGNALFCAEAEDFTENRELGDAATDRVLYGSAHVWEDIGTICLRVSARSFLQVNRAVAARIYHDVAAWVPARARVFDLYCGVGGLGLSVLSLVPQTLLWGIEFNRSAVADATASAAASAAFSARAQFFAGSVETELPQLKPASSATSSVPNSASDVMPPCDVALLNPPRRGCTAAVLHALLHKAPQRIIYVSCNPHSLARDLGVLRPRGYRLHSVTPYDMHPGTPHIETVAMLEKIRPT